MESIVLQIPSLAENIRIVESFIDNIKEQYNINDDIYGNVLVAITEAVNNAIKHGNQEDRQKNVQLALYMADNTVKFTVKDEGEGFDYKNLPDPLLPENLHKVGGRGIFLMKNLADEIHFKENGSLIELVFYMNG